MRAETVKPVLAVLSDLHLTDESTARNVHGTAFDLIGEAIRDRAEDQGAQEIQLVLLGDILDFGRTDYWHRAEEAGRWGWDDRPWNGALDPATGMNRQSDRVEEQLNDVLEGILQTVSCQSLARMLREVPAVGGHPPQVTYVIGNHDRVFHNFPGLQTRLQRALPGVNLVFASHFRSDDYSVLARHGHEWDGDCHGWDFFRKVLQRGHPANRFDPVAYQAMAIGEVITTELMAGLLYRLRQGLDLNRDEDRAFFESFQDVNNLRPFTAVFDWIAWFVRGRGEPYRKYLEKLRLALRDSLAAVLETRLAKRWDQLKGDWGVSGDLTDHLSRAYFLVKQKSGLRLLEGLKKVADTAAEVGRRLGGGSDLDALAEGARKDFEAESAAGRSPQFILYGHTHEARQDCFAGGQDGRVKLYLNTGTFLPFIERARANHGFWTAHRMTFGFVFRDDEDTSGREGSGPTLDLWNGLRRKRYQPRR